MKFVCEQCKTKYSIDDGRVRGKVLKIRCKQCNHIITVREETAAPSGPVGGCRTTVPELRLARPIEPTCAPGTPSVGAAEPERVPAVQTPSCPVAPGVMAVLPVRAKALPPIWKAPVTFVIPANVCAAVQVLARPRLTPRVLAPSRANVGLILSA